MYIILVYDIVLDEKGAKVWRDTFKTCKSQLFTLKKSLAKIIRKDRDSLIIFNSRDEKWLEKEILGIDNGATDNFI